MPRSSRWEALPLVRNGGPGRFFGVKKNRGPEAGSIAGFGISITEDAPVEALERGLFVISRVLKQHGRGR